MDARLPNVSFRPNLMSLIVTYQCPLECGHCSIFSGPRRKQAMSLDEIQRYIDQASSLPSISTLVFTGGEPFLLGKDLPKAVSYASSRGLHVRIVSSAHWGKNKAKAESLLRVLKDSGLKEINISYDAFHRPWVSPQDIHNAIDAALRLGLPTVVSVQVTKSEFYDLSRVEEELNLRVFSSFDVPLYVYIGAATPVGRGKATLDDDDLISINDLIGEGCNENTGCQSALRQLAVFPGGELHICCTEFDRALTAGNLKDSPLSAIVEAANSDVFFSLLATRGPYGIKDSLLELDPALSFRDTYVNQCHLCKELRANASYRPALEILKREHRDIAFVERLVRVALEERLKKEMRDAAGCQNLRSVEFQDRRVARHTQSTA